MPSISKYFFTRLYILQGCGSVAGREMSGIKQINAMLFYYEKYKFKKNYPYNLYLQYRQ